MNSDTKIKISIGCVKYLEEELTRLRRENELIGSENRVMHNFFEMVNRLGGKEGRGFGEDRLWQAKKEIEQAILDVEPDVKPD